MNAIAKGHARSSGYDRAANDWYVEPAHAVDALLDVEAFDGEVWDPACGSGNIPTTCGARGIRAVGSDIADRGYGVTGSDFLSLDFRTSFMPAAHHIITNPPFSLAMEFALRGLRCVPGKVCILQRTVWLEGERRHRELFSKGHLARVWQFRKRISMPPGGADVPAQGGSVAFAWFVFCHDHQGPWAGGWLP